MAGAFRVSRQFQAARENASRPGVAFAHLLPVAMPAVFRFRQLRLAFAATFLCGAAMLRAAITVTPWQPLFRGVDFATATTDSAEPRLQEVRAVRVDLQEPGISFFTTPDNGPAPRETTSETTAEFLRHHRLQVAINANFYEPCCTPGEKDLNGLALSRGMIVSPPSSSGLGTCVLAITRDHRVTVTTTDTRFDPSLYWTAVAGSAIVLADGKKPALPDSLFNRTPNPRSAVGVSRDGRYLVLLVIDGRQPGYSLGATVPEVGDWLLRFGAHAGLNLDGGGSTTLVRAAGDDALVLNRPSGAAKPKPGDPPSAPAARILRSNGNSLGVYAAPLATPATKAP
jgi:uncharacterized protein YigE (DUF2233 family)